MFTSVQAEVNGKAVEGSLASGEGMTKETLRQGELATQAAINTSLHAAMVAQERGADEYRLDPLRQWRLYGGPNR